jgi:hypothetical protein
MRCGRVRLVRPPHGPPTAQQRVVGVGFLREPAAGDQASEWCESDYEPHLTNPAHAPVRPAKDFLVYRFGGMGKLRRISPWSFHNSP